MREQERRKREAVISNPSTLIIPQKNDQFFFFVINWQLAGQIDMNRQSDLMAAFEEML